MDIVFCRNVLLYFDQATKLQILERLAQVIAPGGYLVVGTAEMPERLCAAFQTGAVRGLYVRRHADLKAQTVRPAAPAA